AYDTSRYASCLLYLADLPHFPFLFSLNTSARPEISTLSLHDALPILVRRNPHNVIGEKCCRAYAVARRAKLSARQVPAKGYDLRTRKSRSPQVQTRASRIRLHPHRT